MTKHKNTIVETNQKKIIYDKTQNWKKEKNLIVTKLKYQQNTKKSGKIKLKKSKWKIKTTNSNYKKNCDKTK